MKKIKILCTLGPSSSSADVIHSMIDCGMNAARINTSHGDFDQYTQLINTVRSIANIPIVMDTQGPKVRLRMAHSLRMEKGDTLRVGFHTKDSYFLDADVLNDIHTGAHALIDDGAFDAVVAEKDDRSITFQFQNSGHLVSGRAVNFPSCPLPLPPLTDKDVQSLQFARDRQIDFIALSFTRCKDDIEACRKHLEGSSVKIIAKIENQQGIDHLDEILEYADGVMVARGDMGVELPPQDVPIVQKKIIRASAATDDLVITATQMLQSMISNPRPTRAEISDVANAILDGSDGIMLSGETATGKYPADAVRMMSEIAVATEPFINVQQPALETSIENAIFESVRNLSQSAHANKIVSITRRGHTAKMLSRLRLQTPILALTSSMETFRELQLYFGVKPVLCKELPDSIRTATAGMYLYEKGFIQKDDLIIFVSGEYKPSHKLTNTLQILSMRDLIDYCNTQGIPH